MLVYEVDSHFSLLGFSLTENSKWESGTYSNLCEQEMGVPQGSILSVTLFCLNINSIVKALCPGVECSLYVDNFLVCYRSKHIHIIERHLQRCLNKLQNWADTNGFKFSTSKTVCRHFCCLHLYRGLVRSKLDYGCIVYKSARNSYLRMLDSVQIHAVRLCLSTYRTSPSPSLCVLANEPPLYIQCGKLSIES